MKKWVYILIISKKQVEYPSDVARDDEGNHNMSKYINTLEMDMYIIYKDDIKTRRNIYEVIYEIYFKRVKPFTDEFIEKYKNNPNVPHNIPYDTKGKIK